jgi:hypothetical protein
MTEFHQFENISGHAIKPPVLVQNGRKLSDGLDSNKMASVWYLCDSKDFRVVQV